jgi:hypothetical protein
MGNPDPRATYMSRVGRMDPLGAMRSCLALANYSGAHVDSHEGPRGSRQQMKRRVCPIPLLTINARLSRIPRCVARSASRLDICRCVASKGTVVVLIVTVLSPLPLSCFLRCCNQPRGGILRDHLPIHHNHRRWRVHRALSRTKANDRTLRGAAHQH